MRNLFDAVQHLINVDFFCESRVWWQVGVLSLSSDGAENLQLYFNYTTLNNANTVIIMNRDNINPINRNNWFKDPGFSDIDILLQKITQRGISFLLFNFVFFNLVSVIHTFKFSNFNFEI